MRRTARLFGVACASILALMAGIFMMPEIGRAADAPQTIKIGAVLPLTGRMAQGGNPVALGYQIGIDSINKAGGVYVKEFDKKLPLELIALDDESDPVKTVSKLETLNEQYKVVAYLGGFGSDLHAAAAAVAEKNKIPYLGVGFTLNAIHQKGYKYLFSPWTKTPTVIETTFAMLDSLPEATRPTKIAIFRLQDDWGMEQARYIRELAPKQYKVVAEKDIAMDTKDFSSMILAAKAAGANSMFINPTHPGGVALMKQAKELNWNLDFWFIIRASDSEPWTQALGSTGDYVVGDVVFHPSFTYPEEYTKRTGRFAENTSGGGYACVQVLADSIKRAGVLDRDKIRDAMVSTNMMTIIGPIGGFKPDGTAISAIKDSRLGCLYQWQKGKQEIVWPPNLATAPFAYPAKPFKER